MDKDDSSTNWLHKIIQSTQTLPYSTIVRDSLDLRDKCSLIIHYIHRITPLLSRTRPSVAGTLLDFPIRSRAGGAANGDPIASRPSAASKHPLCNGSHSLGHLDETN